MGRRKILALTLPLLGFAALASGSQAAGPPRAATCGAAAYSYAGIQGDTKAVGVSATVAAVDTPSVSDGHVGGWIGLGGTDAGPGKRAEWVQVGLASFMPDASIRMYYEVAVAGAGPRYVELAANVPAHERHKFAVLELPGRRSWWRVWVDGRPVSPPIHLPGSHAAWYPQAVAESWNGGTGACNAFAYRFSDVRLAVDGGGGWRPLKRGAVFHDAGYRVVETSRDPRTFLASSA